MSAIVCQSLDEVRTQINRIDHEIVKLIAERADYVKRAAFFKKDESSVRAPQRVEQVIDKVKALSVQYHLEPEIIEKIYRTMISSFIEMELNQKKMSDDEKNNKNYFRSIL